MAHSEPLLVVAESGITHIVTVADLAGVAGTAVVLSFLLEVDRRVNELLRGRADQALASVTDKQRSDAEEHCQRAQAEGGGA